MENQRAGGRIDDADQRRKAKEPGGKQIPENGGGGHDALPNPENADGNGWDKKISRLML
jgi:hypothetical protein